jgi:serine/threonine protein kinase
LGKGRFSEAFQAAVLGDASQQVAVKVLTDRIDNPQFKEAFNREALALRTLSHENVISILDAGTTADGYPYLVTELCGAAVAPLSRDFDKGATELALSLLSAIQHAHAHGVIHRDIKPQHILTGKTPGEASIKLIDFGIAKIRRWVGEGQTLGGLFSPGFACREQVEGKEARPEFDLYAIAACIYWHVTGKTPQQDVPLTDQIRESTPNLSRSRLREFAAELARAPETGLKAGVALRQLQQLSQSWVDAPDTYLVLRPDAMARVTAILALEPGQVGPALQKLQDDLDPVDGRFPAVAVERGANDLEAWQSYRYRLIGKTFLLVLQADSSARSFLVQHVEVPDPADLLGHRDTGTEIPAVWIPQRPATAPPRDAASIRPLCQQVIEDESARQRRQAQSGRRADLVERWETLFKLLRASMGEAGNFALYRSWEEKDDLVRVTLAHSPTSRTKWTLGERIAMSRMASDTLIPVGVLVGSANGELVVKPDKTTNLGVVARAGRVGTDRSPDYAAIRRQETALAVIRQGQARNPQLPNIICGVQPPAPLRDVTITSWFHDSLDDAKRAAVRKALGVQDLLLIQGPPGTGKTLAIAEIILQILEREPRDRVLLASQSHVAVDQAIERIHAKRPKVSMLRLASPRREADVSAQAKRRLPAAQLQEWRETVLERSQDHLKQIGLDPAVTRATSSVEELLAEVSRLDAQIKELTSEANTVRGRLGQLSRQSEKGGGESDEADLRDELELLDDELRKVREDREAAVQLAREFFRSHGIDVEGAPSTWGQHVSVVGALVSLRPEQTGLVALWDKWRRQFGRGLPYEAALAKRTRVLAGTCLGVASSKAVDRGEFNWVVIDEAGRATAPELFVPLVRGRRVILVGDHYQLPPVADRELRDEELAQEGLSSDDLKVSLFEQLFNELPETHRVVLDRQYRMHPAIAALISDVFYRGALTSGDGFEPLAPPLPWPTKPVTWITTSRESDRREEAEYPEGRRTFRNDLEVRVVRMVLARWHDALRDSSNPPTIGVIAGYAAQRAALLREIDPSNERWRPLDVEINTVDAFQGRERDLLIYSAVRSNDENDIGFLSDVRRLNVALSRSRHCLVIVGDDRMLRLATGPSNENPFREVLRWIRSHVDVAEVMEAAEC